MIGPTEIILVIAIIALIFFGAPKVKEWAKALGEAKQEFSNPSKDKEAKN